MPGLAPLAGLTGLRELGLSHTQITGAGLEVPARARARGAAPVRLAHQRSGIGAPVGHRLAAGPRPGLYRRDRRRPGSPGVARGAAAARPGGDGRRRQGTPDAGPPDRAQRASCSTTRGSPTRRCPSCEALEHLQELALIRTRITDKSMPIVGRLADLVDLNLDYTDVGDKGLEALGGLTKLERLSLDSTNVTDASATTAAGIPATPQAEPLPHVRHRKKATGRSARRCRSARSSSIPNRAIPSAGEADRPRGTSTESPDTMQESPWFAA